jgi:hypothetical protein
VKGFPRYEGECSSHDQYPARVRGTFEATAERHNTLIQYRIRPHRDTREQLRRWIPCARRDSRLTRVSGDLVATRHTLSASLFPELSPLLSTNVSRERHFEAVTPALSHTGLAQAVTDRFATGRSAARIVRGRGVIACPRLHALPGLEFLSGQIRKCQPINVLSAGCRTVLGGTSATSVQ